MSATVTLSATLDLGGNEVSISKSYTAEFLRTFDFELAAGAIMSLAFDAVLEGADSQFLFIQALNASDLTQHTTVSYGFSDADASVPASGTLWRSVNGLHLSWEDVDLSANGKLYVYNSGSNRASVKVSVGLDGA